MNVNMYDLEAHKDEVRLIPKSEFEAFQLGNNLARSVKIGSWISFEVRSRLTECFQENSDLFSISLQEMPDIDPMVAYHQLNANLDR